MRLKQIKLAGFKSFVDPTTIPVSARLIGIVGPNGCGKSNVIDAVRWVMGESSAKHLRGDSMADVIFSGSNSRKPVSKASVELVFDNSDGRAPGQYAAYAEISIRREASRDGQSEYSINKTRCRRKDITDLFLGTGLGPRTYSIIEQGMVSRIVEAKPEDLRTFLEEAAGISKYKERRRETENRIRHTRENLERVEDIRQELDKQLKKLERQSHAAEKYKELKKEERLLQAQLMTVRWRDLGKQLHERDRALAERDTEVEAMVAKQREAEAALEALRSQQADANDHMGKVQEEFYVLGAEISSIEQKIQHARETRAQQEREQQQINQAWDEASQHLAADEKHLAELVQQQDALAPQLKAAQARLGATQQALQEAEQAMQAWQAEWQNFNTVAAEPEKVREVQGSRIEQAEKHLATLIGRRDRLTEERVDIENELAAESVEELRQQAARLDADGEARERALEQREQELQQQRNEFERLNNELNELRGQQQTAQGRLASLQELQDAAEGKHDDVLNQWLVEQGLKDAPRLSAALRVQPGWEVAVERVLGPRLAAVQVSRLDEVAAAAGHLEKSDLVLVERAAGKAGGAGLLAQVESSVDLAPWLNGINIAESLEEAMAMRSRLQPHESVVTRDGVWLGRNWLSVASRQDARIGMIKRQQEIGNLQSLVRETTAAITGHEQGITTLREFLKTLEQDRDQQRKELNELNRTRTGVHAELGSKESRLNQLQQRQSQIISELDEIQRQQAADNEAMEQSRRLLKEAESLSGTHAQRRAALQDQRGELESAVARARDENHQAREAQHGLDVERQNIETRSETTRKSIERLQGQLAQLSSRREDLSQRLSESTSPEADFRRERETMLEKRLDVESRLSRARQAVADLEHAMREQEQARSTHEAAAQDLRSRTEQDRMQRQELLVRSKTIAERVQENGFEPEAVLEGLPADATEETWQEQLEKMTRRIERLGPINLAAIEEYDESAERKQYLDKQYDDLSQAMHTLEEAIRKIDRETRTRFKETFDRVNTGLQALFPRLFGGGHAYLELTGEDLLETGVSIMARPPGKRNSTIHLLSGGEKALTAVSLIFSIFQLNPAPFCLLDEVDAPLDDANVERYSQILKEMSSETQLLYITHNKISMEIGDILLGVTMSEPGVSRLVAVDMDEAMEMVG